MPIMEKLESIRAQIDSLQDSIESLPIDLSLEDSLSLVRSLRQQIFDFEKLYEV